MNKKAELFKEYLKKNKIEAFTIEEIEQDELNTAVFRSNLDIHGNKLPTIVILDSSIYAMIRILVAPGMLSKDNEADVLKLVNKYNKQYKSLKYYIDDEGALILDSCIIFKVGELDGDMIYSTFNVIIEHLNGSYKDFMKAIWK